MSEVIHATYYDADGLAINAASDLLGIKSSCMQHGGQSRNNPALGGGWRFPLVAMKCCPMSSFAGTGRLPET